MRSFRLFVLALSVASVSACAWWQKTEPALVCAAQDTVANAAQLVAIVTTCASIATSESNIIPCILAAAGTTWPADVIACFAADTATSPNTAPEIKARLAPAVRARWGSRLGW
jgi:hypothetical protein